MRMSFLRLIGVLAALLIAASTALAAGPMWMPGFPMRMGTNVMLMWTPVPGAATYNVYKSEKEGDVGTLMISLPMNNHMDMNVPLEKSVFYTVKAVTGGAEGEAGMVGKLIGLKPVDPPKFAGFMPGDNGVTVRFDAVAGASFYNIFKSESKDGPFNLVGSIQETKYVDTAASEGKTYYYQATAIDKNNVESPKSATFEVVLAKKKVAETAKEWAKVDIVVKYVKRIFSAGEYNFQAPTWAAQDPAGELFVVNDADWFLILDGEGKVLAQFTKPETMTGPFGQVRGLCITRDGNVAATFFNPNVIRVMQTDGVILSEIPFTSPTKEEYAELGREADYEEDKLFESIPLGIVEDPDGNLWVSDPVYSQLRVYDKKGQLLKKFGEVRPRVKKPENVPGLAVLRYHNQTKRIYGVSSLTRSVHIFDAATMDYVKNANGDYVYSYLRSGASPGNTQQPKGMAFTPDGNIVLVDGVDARIQLYDPNMEYLGTILTKPGTDKPDEIGNPVDAAIVGKRLFVTEQLQSRMTIFDMP